MAKNGTNGKRLNIAMVGLVVVIVSIASSSVTRFVNNQHETKDTSKAVSELKAEGCLPARDNEKAIIRVESKVDAFVVEQRAAKKEILDAIKER